LCRGGLSQHLITATSSRSTPEMWPRRWVMFSEGDLPDYLPPRARGWPKMSMCLVPPQWGPYCPCCKVTTQGLFWVLELGIILGPMCQYHESSSPCQYGNYLCKLTGLCTDRAC
jgi:hypothetical protein